MNILFDLIERIRAKITGRNTYIKQSSKRDPLFAETINKIYNDDFVSPSTIQRKMTVGFARAIRIMKDLEDAGMIESLVATPRKVYKNHVQNFLNTIKTNEEAKQSKLFDSPKHD